MTTKPTVLFICKHNAGRSQLGAALLELAAPDRYTATSAGITPADEVMRRVADEMGAGDTFVPTPVGVCVTEQGFRDYGHIRIEARTDPRGYPYYWLALGSIAPPRDDGHRSRYPQMR